MNAVTEHTEPNLAEDSVTQRKANVSVVRTGYVMPLMFLCAGAPGGNGRGQILQPEAWRRQNLRHEAEQEG